MRNRQALYTKDSTKGNIDALESHTYTRTHACMHAQVWRNNVNLLSLIREKNSLTVAALKFTTKFEAIEWAT